MNILEAIDARRSRRAYVSDPIPPSILERLMELMAEFNRDHGLAFRFIEDGGSAFARLSRSYGMFSGVKALMVLAGKEEDPNRAEKCGYFGERLVLEATAYGLGTCWVGGTFDRRNPALGVPEGDTLECVIPVGLVPAEPALRERILHRLTHGFSDAKTGRPKGTARGKDTGKAIETSTGAAPAGDDGENAASSTLQGVDKFVTADDALPDGVRSGIEAALKAPSAMNGKPVRFTWRNGKLTASIPDTYRMQWIDLGIAKYHFVLAAGGTFPWGNGAAWNPQEGAEG